MIVIATDAIDTVLPEIRKELQTLFPDTPTEPSPGIWAWPGDCNIKAIERFSAKFTSTVVWAELDYDMGELCIRQFQLYGGACELAGFILGEPDDDGIFGELISGWAINGGFDRSKVRRLQTSTQYEKDADSRT